MTDAEFLYRITMAAVDPDLAEHAQFVLRDVRNSREQVKNQARQYDEISVQLNITSQDRDNRRRRMELAMTILDETQALDLDSIAVIVWPQPKSEHEIFMAGFARGTQEGLSPSPVYAPRTFGVPEEILRARAVPVSCPKGHPLSSSDCSATCFVDTFGMDDATRPNQCALRSPYDTVGKVNWCKLGKDHDGEHLDTAGNSWTAQPDPTAIPTPAVDPLTNPMPRPAPYFIHKFLDDGKTLRCQSLAPLGDGRNQCVYADPHVDEPHMDHTSFEW